MTFLELPPSELDPQFGPRFLYRAYLQLQKSTQKPDKLVLILKRDFAELQNQVKSSQTSLEKAQAEFAKSLAEFEVVQKEFLEASKSVPGPVSPIVMTVVDVPK